MITININATMAAWVTTISSAIHIIIVRSSPLTQRRCRHGETKDHQPNQQMLAQEFGLM